MATNDIFRKSIKYVGATISKQLMPDIGATISANKDYSDEIRSESKKIVSKLDESLFGGQINGVTNIFKNFKGSNNTNTSQGINKNTSKVGGVDTDFIESSILSNSAMNKTNRRGFSTVAAVSTKVGSKQIQALGLIHNDLNKLVRFNTTHTAKMYDNMNNFFSETSKFYSQFFTHLQKEKVQEEKLRKVGEKAKLTEIFLMKEYLDGVQENLNKTLKTNNNDLIKSLSPKFIKDFSTEVLGGVMTKALTKTFAGLGKTIANIPSMLTMELGRWGENSKNPLMKQLGKILGIDLTKKGLDARKANREKAVFDNGTKKAIMTTIPSLLSKILNAIQSQNTFDPKKFNKGQETELIYDYDKQNFSNRKKKKKETEKEYKIILDTYMGDYQREVMSMITKTITNPKMQQSMMNSVINSMGDIVSNPTNAKAFAKGKLTSKMTSADENIISLINSINQNKNSSAQANLYAQTGKVVKNTNSLMRNMEQDPYSGRSNAYDNTRNVKKSIIKGANRKTKGTVNIDPDQITYQQELDAINETNKATLTNNRDKSKRYGLKGKGIGLVQDVMNRPLEMLAKGIDTFVGKLTGFIMNDDDLMNNGFLSWFKGLMNEKIFDPIRKTVLDPITGWFKTKSKEIGTLITEPIREALKSWKEKNITPKLDIGKEILSTMKIYLFGTKNDETGKNNKDGWFSTKFKDFTSLLDSAKTAIFGDKKEIKEGDIVSTKEKSILKKMGITAGKGAIFSIFAPGGPILGAMMGLFTETKAYANSIGKAKNSFKEFIFGKFDDVKGKFNKNGLIMDILANVHGYMETTKERLNSWIFGDDDSSSDFIKKGGLVGYLKTVVDNIKNGSAKDSLTGKATSGLNRFESWASKHIADPFNERLDQLKDVLKNDIAEPVKNIAENVLTLAKTYGNKLARKFWELISGQNDSKVGKVIGRIFQPILYGISKFVDSVNWVAKKMIGLGKILVSPLKLLSSLTDKIVKKADPTGAVRDTIQKTREASKEKAAKWSKERAEKRAENRLKKANRKLSPDGIIIKDELSKSNNILENILEITKAIASNKENIPSERTPLSNPPALVDDIKPKKEGIFDKFKNKIKSISNKDNSIIKTENTASGMRTIELQEKAAEAENKFRVALTKSSDITAKSTSGIYKSGSKIWKLLMTLVPAITGIASTIFKWFAGTKIGKAVIGGVNNVKDFLGFGKGKKAGGAVDNVIDMVEVAPGQFAPKSSKGVVSKVGSGIKNVASKTGSMASKAGGVITKAGSGISKFASTAAGGAAIGAGGALVGGALLVDDYSKAKAKGKEGLALAGETLLGDTGDSFGDTLKNAGKQGIKYAGIGAAIGTIVPGFGTLIGGAVGGIIGLVAGIFGSDPKKSMDNIKKGFSSIGDFFGKMMSGIGDFVGKAVDMVKSIIESVGKAVFSVFKFLFNPIGTLMNAFTKSDKDPEKTWVEKAIGSIGKAVFSIFNTLTFGLGDTLVDFFTKNPVGKAITGVLITIGDTVGWIFDKIGDFFGGIWNFFTEDLWGIFKPVGSVLGWIFDAIKGVWNAIKTGVGWLGDVLGGAIGVVTDTLGFLLKPIKFALDTIGNVIGAITAPFKAVGKFVMDFFGKKTDDKLAKKDAYDNTPSQADTKKPEFRSGESDMETELFASKNVTATYKDAPSSGGGSDDIKKPSSGATANAVPETKSEKKTSDVTPIKPINQVSDNLDNIKIEDTPEGKKKKEEEDKKIKDKFDPSKKAKFNFTFGEELFKVLKMFFKPLYGVDFKKSANKMDTVEKLETTLKSKNLSKTEKVVHTANILKDSKKATDDIQVENEKAMTEGGSTEEKPSGNAVFKESNTAAVANKSTDETNNMGVGGASDTPIDTINKANNTTTNAVMKPIGGIQQGFSNASNAIFGKKKTNNINKNAYSGGDSDASGIQTANKIGSGSLKGGTLGKTSGNLLKGSTRVSAVDMGFGKLQASSSSSSEESSSSSSSYSSSGGGKYKEMGQLAAKYESGGNPASISKAAGDAGGASYGVFQFSKNMGSLKSFLDWLKGENSKLHSLFEGKELGSNSFDDAWKKAAEDPEFEELQYKRIYETFFKTANNNFKDITGVDSESSSSLGLQNAIWSTGVQMGPNTSVFKNAGLKGKSTKDIISAIYDERGAGNGSKYFSSSSGQIQASVANRFQREKADALALGGANQTYVKNVITNDQSKLRSQQSHNNYGIGGSSDKDKKKYADANEFFLDKGIHNFTAVTSGYGEDRTLPNGTTDHHWGIDYGGAPEGSPIRTPAAGEIIKKERNDAWGMGNWVVIRDDNNNYHMFMHQQKLIEDFKVGDKVKAGDQIGYVGNTGNSFGAHLHYQIDEGTMSPINGPHAMNPNGYKFPGDLVMGSMSSSSSNSDSKEGSDDSKTKFGYKEYLKIKQGSTGDGVSSALASLMRGSYGGAIDDNLLKNKYNTPKYRNLMGTDYMAKAVKPRDKKFHVYNSGNIKPGFDKTNVGGAKNYIYGFGGASTSPSLVANNLNLNYESLSSTNRLLYAMYNVLVSIDGSAKGILDKELKVVVSTEGSKIPTSANNNNNDDKDETSVNLFTPIVNNMSSGNSNSQDNHSLSKKIKIIAQGD